MVIGVTSFRKEHETNEKKLIKFSRTKSFCVGSLFNFKKKLILKCFSNNLYVRKESLLWL